MTVGKIDYFSTPVEGSILKFSNGVWSPNAFGNAVVPHYFAMNNSTYNTSGGTYTTICSVSNVDIQGDALVIFNASVYEASNYYTLYVRLLVDDSEIMNRAVTGTPVSAANYNMTLSQQVTLGSGTHTITIQGRDDGHVFTIFATLGSLAVHGFYVNVVDPSFVAGGRLTLTTDTPVTTSDVTGSTIYYTPYMSDRISLYNGSSWPMLSFTEKSLALTVTSGNNYDVFAYASSGNVALELSAAWTNATTRADAVSRQNGVLVKTADKTRRYLGTIRASATNTVADTLLQRFLWNMYNKEKRTLLKVDSSAPHSYSGGLRQLNADANNKVEIVTGQSVPVTARPGLGAYVSSGGNSVSTGVGIDSTSVDSCTSQEGIWSTGASQPLYSRYEGYLIGYHALNWLEAAGQSTNIYGNVGFYAELYG